MKKLLHERLREWADSTEGNQYPSTEMLYATIESDHAPLGADDERKAFHLLADEIEKYYIPRPRFEDGEPVQSSDMEEIGGLATCRVYTDGSWKFDPDKYEDERNPKPWDEQQGRQCDFIKRPEPKVLDADGVPTKKGDKVWDITQKVRDNPFLGGELLVVDVTEGDESVCFLDPRMVSHKEPGSYEELQEMLREENPKGDGDSYEKLRDDLKRKYGSNSSWVKRLTALMERDA